MTEKLTSRSGWRINILIIAIFFISSLVFARIFYISYFQHSELLKTAKNQQEKIKDLRVERGEILIQAAGGKKINVAGKNESPYIYLVPKQSADPQKTAKELSAIIPSIPQDLILRLLSKENDPFELVEKKISQVSVKLIKNMNLPDVRVGYENERLYPLESSLAHVIGFLGFKDGKRVGQYGLEGFYDEFLRDNAGLALTVDEAVQSAVEGNLDDLMEKWSASSGTIIVQEPGSGAIIAMASSPSFDPNFYGKYKLERFINPAVQEMFEPGSTFKVFTMSAAIDTGKISPLTTYEDRGIVNIGGYTIKNFDEKAHGIKTMTQVLEKSLNTGAVFVQKLLGDDPFLNYIVNFGFGKKTGIDLEGEISGDIANLYSKRAVNFATASFGQGIAVTPLQLVGAYSAIANGGRLMKPYFVNEIFYPDGRVEKIGPKIVSVPITEKTSSQLKTMLVSVVENGFDKARVPGYDIAAKTGTAQIAKPGGYSDDFVHDMVGFAPAFSPRFTILIKLEKPKGIRFAADSLSPAFKNLAKFLLNYYKISPNPK